MEYPQIILLNGASSSGKSTFAKQLRSSIDFPYYGFSSDQLVDSGMLPKVDRNKPDTIWSWNIHRPKFFKGFHKSIKSFADSGLYLIVDHVVEYQEWFDELVDILSPFSVLYIGVTCPIEEIERREMQRGDRYIGEGKSHIDDGIHTWSDYDLVIDTHLQTQEENISKVLEKLTTFNPSEGVFKKSYKSIR
jgi:chloramphenicol 3-O phosphotransferase